MPKLSKTKEPKGRREIQLRGLTEREKLAQVQGRQVTVETTLRGAIFLGFTTGPDEAVFAVNSGRSQITIELGDIKSFKLCHTAEATEKARTAAKQARNKQKHQRRRRGRTRQERAPQPSTQAMNEAPAATARAMEVPDPSGSAFFGSDQAQATG